MCEIRRIVNAATHEKRVPERRHSRVDDRVSDVLIHVVPAGIRQSESLISGRLAETSKI